MQTELELAALREAVIEFLNQYYKDDLWGERPSWPSELVNLTNWAPPEDIDEDY